MGLILGLKHSQLGPCSQNRRFLVNSSNEGPRFIRFAGLFIDEVKWYDIGVLNLFLMSERIRISSQILLRINIVLILLKALQKLSKIKLFGYQQIG